MSALAQTKLSHQWFAPVSSCPPRFWLERAVPSPRGASSLSSSCRLRRLASRTSACSCTGLVSLSIEAKKILKQKTVFAVWQYLTMQGWSSSVLRPPVHVNVSSGLFLLCSRLQCNGGETHRINLFLVGASSPTWLPCNIHAAITMHFGTKDSKNMLTAMCGNTRNRLKQPLQRGLLRALAEPSPTCRKTAY